MLQSQYNIINEIYQINNGNIDLLHYNDCIFYMFYQQGPVLFKNVTFDVGQQILVQSYSGPCNNESVSEIHCFYTMCLYTVKNLINFNRL